MADPQQESALNIQPESQAPYPISRTQPDVLVRHDISDEELNVLVDTRREYLWEGMWVVGGIFLGLAKPAVEALIAFGAKGQDAITGGDLFEIVAFFVSLAVFVALAFVMWGKGSLAKDTAKEIRERTPREV